MCRQLTITWGTALGEPTPFGEPVALIVSGGIIIIGFVGGYYYIKKADEGGEEEGEEEIDVPDYPGNDPAEVPGDEWEWRGKPDSEPGDDEGNWYNPETGESLNPDLDHPDPIGPHWDWKGSDGKWRRLYLDGSVELKK